MTRAVTLTDDERRAVVLPGDRSYDHFASLHTKPVAIAQHVSLRPVDPKRRKVVLVDVTTEGHTCWYFVDEGDTTGAAPSDVVIGCAVATRLFNAAAAALPEDEGSLAWFGRLGPLALTARDVTAYVMPRRCCGNGASMTMRGRLWDAAAREYRDCPCRDCAAGRRWGW